MSRQNTASTRHIPILVIRVISMGDDYSASTLLCHDQL
jgi:hypothetical protein